MRTLLLCLAFLAAPFLRAQATLSVSPGQPRVGALTTVTLSGVTAVSVTWNFGDGSVPAAGGSIASHTYVAPGSYIVRATYTLSTMSGLTGTVQRAVRVIEPRTITYRPAAPSAGQPVTLQAVSFFQTLGIGWDFGDGTQPVISDTYHITHTFARNGAYTISATDQGDGATIRAQVVIGALGPGAPFSISYLALRWEDGTVRRTVNRGDSGLAVYADLKYEGTGQLQAQWLVDGVPFRGFSRQLAFAQRLTLSSGQITPGGPQVSLPTDIPGEHTVTLNVLQPDLAFQVPVIHYFVSLGPDPDGPVLKDVLPKRVRAGEEVELQLSGPRLKADMELHLGRDMAVVGPIRLVGPETALVPVFVAPTARSGARILRACRDKGSPAGTAKLEILPALKKRSNRN
jgi:hypothetical protein